MVTFCYRSQKQLYHPYEKLTEQLNNDFNNLFKTTFNNGSLGSRIDEERSEMRYVM